ncbi:MAG: hypothetical protein ACE5R6_09090 [Candidatus Heimdallarchaeota archaeon]
MQIRNNLNNQALGLLLLLLIFLSSPLMISNSKSGEITIKGTSHYAFTLGILDDDTKVQWDINVTNGISVSLYIAEAAQYELYVKDLPWSPVYENTSRTLHRNFNPQKFDEKSLFTIPTKANWTLVLENSNQADALVTYDIGIYVQIGGFTLILSLLGLFLAIVLFKRRKKESLPK